MASEKLLFSMPCSGTICCGQNHLLRGLEADAGQSGVLEGEICQDLKLFLKVHLQRSMSTGVQTGDTGDIIQFTNNGLHKLAEMSRSWQLFRN